MASQEDAVCFSGECCTRSPYFYKAVWTPSSGVARGGQKGELPPLFQGERVGGRAICRVATLGDEQTRRGIGYGD